MTTNIAEVLNAARETLHSAYNATEDETERVILATVIDTITEVEIFAGIA